MTLGILGISHCILSHIHSESRVTLAKIIDVLPIIISGAQKSPTITVEFSIYAFNYVSFSFMYFGGLFWVRFTCIYILGLPHGLTLLPL